MEDDDDSDEDVGKAINLGDQLDSDSDEKSDDVEKAGRDGQES